MTTTTLRPSGVKTAATQSSGPGPGSGSPDGRPGRHIPQQDVAGRVRADGGAPVGSQVDGVGEPVEAGQRRAQRRSRRQIPQAHECRSGRRSIRVWPSVETSDDNTPASSARTVLTIRCAAVSQITKSPPSSQPVETTSCEPSGVNAQLLDGAARRNLPSGSSGVAGLQT